MRTKRFFLLSLVCLLMLSRGAAGQTAADSLYSAARTAAYEAKNNSLAIKLSEEALALRPEMAHYRVFLARVQAWDAQYAVAEQNLLTVLEQNQRHVDARLALLDVLLWSGQYVAMETIALEGLALFPDNLEMLTKLGVAQASMGQAKAAQATFLAVLAQDANYPGVAEQLVNLQDALKHRKIRAILAYDRLADTQTAWQFLVVEPSMDPWTLMALEYEHATEYGPVILRYSSASRFNTRGSIAELEAYPSIRKTTYGYVGFGLSGSSIFPEWRGGLELFQDMGAGYEASLGLRYLKVPAEGISVLTGSVGKYLGNYWLNARIFLTPQNESLSKSLNFVVRRYLSDADQYLELSGGSGEVPDESLGAEELDYLGSRRVELVWQTRILRSSYLQVRASLSNQEVRAGAFRGMSGMSLAWEQRF